MRHFQLIIYSDLFLFYMLVTVDSKNRKKIRNKTVLYSNEEESHLNG
jgi:predicted phosphatase